MVATKRRAMGRLRSSGHAVWETSDRMTPSAFLRSHRRKDQMRRLGDWLIDPKCFSARIASASPAFAVALMDNGRRRSASVSVQAAGWGGHCPRTSREIVSGVRNWVQESGAYGLCAHPQQCRRPFVLYARGRMTAVLATLDAPMKGQVIIFLQYAIVFVRLSGAPKK